MLAPLLCADGMEGSAWGLRCLSELLAFLAPGHEDLERSARKLERAKCEHRRLFFLRSDESYERRQPKAIDPMAVAPCRPPAGCSRRISPAPASKGSGSGFEQKAGTDLGVEDETRSRDAGRQERLQVIRHMSMCHHGTFTGMEEPKKRAADAM
eukprot:767710-Hanusia_phi.AAC.2